jgi:prenyltransferase beta subunit
MRSLERLSANIFRRLTGIQAEILGQLSPEAVLKRSLGMLDINAYNDLKNYIGGRTHPSGGFKDRAGKPDLYYTLFGTFLAEALELQEILNTTRHYIENEIRIHEPVGVHLHCASILASKLSADKRLKSDLQKRIRTNLDDTLLKNPAYGMFVTMLACYYSGDYKGFFRIRKHLKSLPLNEHVPSTVLAALAVLQHTFRRSTGDLTNKLMEFYDGHGGFRAVNTAPVPDLLSTAVTLYSFYFTRQDLRSIKPECLVFIDSLYQEGGFGANILDPEPDIEYTFYGLLALGSLA